MSGFIVRFTLQLAILLLVKS